MVCLMVFLEIGLPIPSHVFKCLEKCLKHHVPGCNCHWLGVVSRFPSLIWGWPWSKWVCPKWDILQDRSFKREDGSSKPWNFGEPHFQTHWSYISYCPCSPVPLRSWRRVPWAESARPVGPSIAKFRKGGVQNQECIGGATTSNPDIWWKQQKNILLIKG